MGAGLYSITTRSSGTTLTASIYNSDHLVHLTNSNLEQHDDYSTNAAQMRTQTDPGESGTESLPTSAAGELERLRFIINEMKGTTYWYETAAKPTLGTATASTSGTSVDFTIPSWAKRIDINFVGVSTNGTDAYLIQLGDPTVETSGYLGASTVLPNAGSITTVNYTTGFGIVSASAANVWHGTVTLTLENASAFTWAAFGVLSTSNGANSSITSGSKSTSAAMSVVRITTLSGTDAFDAGAINVSYI